MTNSDETTGGVARSRQQANVIAAPIDPTANVIALVMAEKEHGKEIRELENKFYDSANLFLQKEVTLRAEHNKEMRSAEKDRLDSIRQVDQMAARSEADRGDRAIQALATITATNAETLRTALNATAQTIAKQTADAAQANQKQMADSFSEITTRIAALEKSSYEGAGKQTVADPALAALTESVATLIRLQQSGSGEQKGKDDSWQKLIAVMGLIGILGGLGIFAAFKSGTPSPQVIYQPAPTHIAPQ